MSVVRFDKRMSGILTNVKVFNKGFRSLIHETKSFDHCFLFFANIYSYIAILLSDKTKQKLVEKRFISTLTSVLN